MVENDSHPVSIGRTVIAAIITVLICIPGVYYAFSQPISAQASASREQQSSTDYSILADPAIPLVSRTTTSFTRATSRSVVLPTAAKILESESEKYELPEAVDPNYDTVVYPSNGVWMWPVPHQVITSPFGMRSDPFHGRPSFHTGVDFGESCGTQVLAVQAGVVTYAATMGGYGMRVEVAHADGFSSTYNHLEHIRVHVGDQVRMGEPVGKVGTTGRSTGCHLHFEILKDGKFVDPMTYLNGNGTANSVAVDYDEPSSPQTPATDDAPSAQSTPSTSAGQLDDPCQPLRNLDDTEASEKTVTVVLDSGESVTFGLAADGTCEIRPDAEPTPISEQSQPALDEVDPTPQDSAPAPSDTAASVLGGAQTAAPEPSVSSDTPQPEDR